MARVEYKSTPGGVLQRRNGDAWAGVTITHSGNPVYAAATGGTTYAGSLTTNIDGEVPGWLDPGVYTTTNPVNGKSVTFEVGAIAGADTLVPKSSSQSAEQANTPVFEVIPKTAGVAPCQVQLQSFANTGAGAGTFNRGVWFGFNAGRYAGGSSTAGKHGVYMGFEDNYFDAAGDATYGVEWYVGYTTPDNTTIRSGDLRPFYFRVPASDVNSTLKNVIAWVDVGAGASGNFSVMGSVLTGTELFIVHKSLGIFNRLPAYFTANNAAAGGAGTIQVKPTDGYAQVDIVAPGTGVGGSYALVAFKVVGTYRWAIAGTTGSFEIQDSTNSARLHVQLTPGASNTAAGTILNSNLRVNGNVGFYNIAPVAKPTGVAVTAAGIHAALVTLGLIAA